MTFGKSDSLHRLSFEVKKQIPVYSKWKKNNNKIKKEKKKTLFKLQNS